MNEQEIDEVFIALKKLDQDKLIEMSGVDTTGWTEGHLTKEHANLVMDSIMAKIEHGDYEYFLSKIEKVEYIEEFFSFMSHSSKVDDIKKILAEKDKWNIPLHCLKDLIIATKDSSYMMEFIENDENLKRLKERPEYIIGIIEATNNENNYITEIIENKPKREKFGFNSNDLAELVVAMKGKKQNYVESIIEAKEEYGFSQEEIVAIITRGGEPQYIKSILEDDNNVKEFGLTSNQIIDLIIATDDSEYIKGYINSKEKVKYFGFNKHELGRLCLATKDLLYIEEYIKQNQLKDSEITDRKVKLPAEMTIGVEIESEGIASREFLSLKDGIIEDGWKATQDLSIDNGVEIVSPILKGQDEKTTESIKRVCKTLQIFRSKCV